MKQPRCRWSADGHLRCLRSRTAAWLGCAWLVLLSTSTTAQLLTPESPEVKQAVERAKKYLGSAPQDKHIGGECLISLALLKSGSEASHARIQATADEVVRRLAEGDHQLETDNYDNAFSIIFLANLDAEKYQPQIQRLIELLIAQQKPHGGWGYPHEKTGDIPRMQYAVLALWEAHHAGHQVSVEHWEAVTNYLLRTQDPGGGYGYQGTEGTAAQLVQQTGISPTRTAAGVCSLYISQDYLRLAVDRTGADGLPTALRRVEEDGETEPAGPRTTNVNVSRLRQAQEMGDRWFDENYEPQPNDEHRYTHYYLYALERYQTFRETFRPDAITSSKNWYDDAARQTLSEQQENGSFHRSSERLQTPHATSFCVLFLVRSTKKSFDRIGGGTLVGGRGLPTDSQDLQLSGGRITAKPLEGPAEQLLSLMEDPSNPEYLSAVEGFRALAETADEEEIDVHAERLRELAGGTDPDARIAAVRALGRSNDLDNVPTLIYALTDPDGRVAREAAASLRRISRKLSGFELEGELTEAVRAAAIQRWKDWYLSIRPDAELKD